MTLAGADSVAILSLLSISRENFVQDQFPETSRGSSCSTLSYNSSSAEESLCLLMTSMKQMTTLHFQMAPPTPKHQQQEPDKVYQ